jgi:hypothetical protein
MRGLMIAGVLLIAFGLVGLVAGGLTYTKSKETADLGPLDITVKEKKHVAIPTGLSVAAVVGGVVLLVAGTRRRGST